MAPMMAVARERLSPVAAVSLDQQYRAASDSLSGAIHPEGRWGKFTPANSGASGFPADFDRLRIEPLRPPPRWLHDHRYQSVDHRALPVTVE
jgi:hypothetical protein